METAESQTLHGRLGEVFTYSEAMSQGLPDRRLYALRDTGELITLGRGLYRWADAPAADLDLIEIAERAPRATLCLETALAHHDLIDAIPVSIGIAIPRGDTRPKLQAPHRLHQFDRSTFDIGRDTIDVGARRPLGIYSEQRALIDLVRLRHDQGSELAWEALRRWLSGHGRNPGQLITMARQFKGAEAPLRSALEVLL
ncbi:MAG TPA: type IV toxin-antitoxin system AbiEi family antitoxin domain-containing protein [Acidimicrobiales bacterium]|nr:type IV toxin-antitoxin system AbiEi family antitoxin domain-containing protein [Acidimicrobiales bacterium]